MNKKAFTLVELLAVITILGLLAVIIIPKVTKTINDSEQKTNMASARNLVQAATYKTTNNEITGTIENKKINYTTGENVNYLDYTGTKPTNGQVHIKSNGQIAMAVKFGDNCYLKAYNSDDITTIPYNENTCGENSNVFTNYTMPELATTGDGLYQAIGEPNRYIYSGSNPNNYIWLDENDDATKASTEIYRIISYESDGTIKVIRDTSIDSIAWDNRTDASSGPRHNENNTYCNYTGTYYGCNVWGTQENTYYNDATLSVLDSNFFYKYYPSNTTQSLQNFTNTGTVTQNSSLNDYLNTEWTPAQTLNNYIAEHSFNVGGIYYTTTYPANNAKSLIQEKEEQNSYTWNGKIGLMNITDYVEASLNPTCTSVYSNFYYNSNYYYDTNSDGTKDQTITEYDNWPCSNRAYNWLPKAITEWSLSPISYYRHRVWYVYRSGTFHSDGYAYNSFGVRPAFYFKSSIKLGGFGTSDNPYYIIES